MIAYYAIQKFNMIQIPYKGNEDVWAIITLFSTVVAVRHRH